MPMVEYLFECEFEDHWKTHTPATFRMLQTTDGDDDEPGAEHTYACASCAMRMGWIDSIPHVTPLVLTP